ncbi:MAG: zeta toxin family protein [Bacilli bacterium]|nr:zeta toxin family protein [Bacilli bacterium]
MPNIDRSVIRVNASLESEIERKGQDYFIKLASEHTDECIEKYKNLEQSFGGRYVCSDLFKEIFPLYNSDRNSRNLFISAVHNSSACLANEQFQRLAKDESISDCVFLTGIPGAGKSFFIESLRESGELKENMVIYEGDINSLDTIRQKINVMQENGKKVHIIVVNPTIELAYKNACKRLEIVGRGASKKTIARIASGIPGALQTLNIEFKDLDIGIYDKKTNTDIKSYVGIENLDLLDHGSFNEILDELDQLEAKAKQIREDRIERHIN